MHRFKKIFPLVLLAFVAVVTALVLPKLQVNENLNATLPGSQVLSDVEPFLEKGKKTVIFSLQISDFKDDVFSIDSVAEVFAADVGQAFATEISALTYSSDIDPEAFSTFVAKHTYLFLNAADYATVEAKIQPHSMAKTMAENKATLASPHGIGRAKMLMQDPLHISSIAYKKLGASVDVAKLIAQNGLFISEDGSRLLLHGQLLVDAENVQAIKETADKLRAFKARWNTKNPTAQSDFFGAFLITEANANQIKSDIILTVNLALLCIITLLLVYYRNVPTLFFFVLPGLFGLAMALCVLYFLQGGISALALSAGAVILGIVVDYSFHFFSHYSQDGNPYETRNKIWVPMAVSSATTVVAFFSLTFANSAALKDFGLFTALSLIYTMAFILTLLPGLLHVFNVGKKSAKTTKIDKLVARLAKVDFKAPKTVVAVVFALTVVFAFFAGDVKFEDDLNKINFYPQALKNRELAHQNINPDVQKRVTIVAWGETENQAIANNRALFKALNAPAMQENLQTFNGIGGFVFSKEEAAQKAKLWNTFWQKNGLAFDVAFSKICAEQGFSARAFAPFYAQINQPKKPETGMAFAQQFASLNQLILQGNAGTNVLNTVVLPHSNLPKLKAELHNLTGVILVDGAGVVKAMIEIIKADFNMLLFIASITVFLALLLVYGRIELTLIAFLPMVFSWIWILGLAAIFGIKFNFINIIIATIIFGLGDDFAIFIADGLQQRYTRNAKVLATHQAGILLSSVSTIVGMAALLFAKHPAIHSIATISVLGIATIVLISFVVQPFLYRVLILNRTEKGKPPLTFFSLLSSVYSFGLFAVGCIFISILTALIVVLPGLSKANKKFLVHRLIAFFTRLLVRTSPNVRLRIQSAKHLDFTNPSIIIANHTSFLDILFIAMLHPKLIIMVGPWVYRSPLFGWFIRFADYIPAFAPIEENIPRVEKLVSEGYSILIFPEGHRSADGKIKRFHKGAFYLSQTLRIDITPAVILGAHYALPKGEFYTKKATVFLKFLPRIAWDDDRFGSSYSAKTKGISKYIKAEFEIAKHELETANVLANPLQLAYTYKGPILEWYFRIKYKFESSVYSLVDAVIADKKVIYDLGCGNGFLSYFLLLRDSNRKIYGVDYDEEKISLAQHCYLKTNAIHFAAADVSTVNTEQADAILLLDVLHYLSPEKQLQTLNNCVPALQNGGVLLLKDGLADDAEKHAWTEKSERWSTRWVKFNKTENELHFFTKTWLETWAQSQGLKMDILQESEKSSNVLVILQKA